VQVNPPSLENTSSIIRTAYSNGIFSNSAELHEKASKTLAQHVNSKFYGYLASNNTMALTACLISIGVRNKYVLISNFTFPATLDAVILAGGIPIICDIDSDSLVLDTEKVKTLLEKDDFEIAAVLPTRIFGFVTDMTELISTCDAYGVPVVVDAAASFPSSCKSWNFSKAALYEVFSLHATKVFGIGEGGFIIGDSESIEKVRQSSNFGFFTDGTMHFRDGLNAKADEFTAARVLARFNEYSDDVVLRREFVEIYKDVIAEFQKIRTVHEGPDAIYSYFPIIFPSEEQLLQFQKMVSPFILSRRYYFPTLRIGYSGDADVIFDGDLEVSESIAKRILCLPVYVSYAEDVKREIKNLVKCALESVL
jgi:dTDP-4-amino-4,6-dideoxygalactose transaminase